MARKIVDNHRTRMPRPPITDHSGADPRRSPLAPSDPSLGRHLATVSSYTSTCSGTRARAHVDAQPPLHCLLVGWSW